MALHAVGLTTQDKEATVRLFQGLGLEFTQYGEGHHMEATTGGMTIMVDTLELMKRSKPDYKFSPETCAVHLAFKCDTSAAVDELFAKLQGKGETQKEPWDAPWGQRYATVRDTGSGVLIDLFSDLSAESK
eukprot:CAMPEP_0181444954 /NCGR_PEP_ID=MMETSP1110-20121109/25340_1 /TAXON_ID=174948 /ORGANISM="Symbiodinium sp., Strain CCMP421" /LENGTH=130 /DNA_ID=CAMNT_0023568987 /DNA_START=19 /DNA_END=411 /DNA_ORIENTATION=+